MARKKKTIIGGISFIALLVILSTQYGAVITTDGDKFCATECNSTIDVYLPNYSVSFILKDGLEFYFDKNVSYEVYKKNSKGKETKITNVSKITFSKGHNIFKLVGHKKSEETIKWGVRGVGKDIDPYWVGETNSTNSTLIYEEPKTYIGYKNLEVGTKNSTGCNLNVNFYHVKNDLTEQIFNISVQNLQNTIRDINVSQFVEPLTYTANRSSMNFYEWKNVSSIIPHYDSVLVPLTCWNTTFGNSTEVLNSTGVLLTNTSYDCSYISLIENGTDTVWNRVWKDSKSQAFNLNTNEYKENMGLINIPKFESKEKDATVNGTKWFQVIIPTPITNNGEGWGSSGIYKMQINDCVFYDLQNSSWWNTSWNYVRPITITNSSVLSDYQVLVNITNTTNMNTTGQDLRFTYNDNTTVLSYWIENFTTNNAQIWVRTNQSIVNMWYGNAGAASASNITAVFPQPTTSTGGTIIYSSNYAIHTFTGDGTFTANKSMNVEVLMVGGGGGGAGGTGGGGGSGGLIYNNSVAITPQSYSITIGGGGAGNPADGGNGAVGGNTIALGYTAYGGGAGNHATSGGAGGSGGGGGYGTSAGGSATSGQGNAGGSTTGTGNPYYTGGGGGGAGAVGASVTTSYNGGAGGDGVSTYSGLLIAANAGENISGVHWIAGGGAGGTGGTTAAGGKGGGGASVNDVNGANGLANTGGGGAASGTNSNNDGGNGGSGIVIIRYVNRNYVSPEPTLSIGAEETQVTYTLSGTVKDKNLAVVNGATVYIISQATNTTIATVITNSTGGWSYSLGTTTGNYTIVAENRNNISQGGGINPHIVVS